MQRHIELEKLIEPLLLDTVYELVGVEFSRGNKRALLRVYIDKTGGVTIDDIAHVSRQISAYLDVEGPELGEYILEVSSPGLDRPLFRLEHFKKQLGSQLQFKLSHPIDGRQRFKGILQRVEGENLHFLVDDQEVLFSFDHIEKARVVPNIKIGTTGKKGA